MTNVPNPVSKADRWEEIFDRLDLMVTRMTMLVERVEVVERRRAEDGES
ncbi:MAG: hypothetical protein ACSLE8_05810 [Rhodococcus sp. (in: high G+C Gram-positive bacteria)]